MYGGSYLRSCSLLFLLQLALVPPHDDCSEQFCLPGARLAYMPLSLYQHTCHYLSTNIPNVRTYVRTIYYLIPGTTYACTVIVKAIGIGFSTPRGAPALPSATGPPAAARRCHARPTQQPSVSPAKERAPPSNSAARGVERCPPGDGLLDPRDGDGSPGREGFPSFSEAFPSGFSWQLF